MSRVKKRGVIVLTIFLIILLSISVNADVTATLDVTWANIYTNLHIVNICVSNTDKFGAFDNILIDAEKDDHVFPPSIVYDTFTDQGGNRWCADLDAGSTWDSVPAADTLSSAKIYVRNSENRIIYRDNAWSRNVPDNWSDPTHLFIGETQDTCTEPTEEICNNIDDDCDGGIDEGDICCQDADEDGLCAQDDNCPGVFNPEQEDADEDGLGNECDYKLSIISDDLLWITPKVLNINPGILTAHTDFPYLDYIITDATLDDVAYDEIADKNIKFNRQDFDQEALDTHFDIWGRFIYNGKVFEFIGEDYITEIKSEKAGEDNMVKIKVPKKSIKKE